MKEKTVIIAYKYIPRYRLSFFKRLNDLCDDVGINLKIIYGDPGKDDALKAHAVPFDGGVFRRNTFISIGGSECIWQPVLDDIRAADLVVVEQASKLLLNYLLIVRQAAGWQRFAFWGHGKNYQSRNATGFAEGFKRRMVPLPHWWFAYTDGVAKHIEEAGFARDRITVVYNSIDTNDLINLRSRISHGEIAEIRTALGLRSDRVCLYIGSMYPDKRIGFLLQACTRIHERLSDFTILFVGAGSDQNLVQQFCAINPWAKYVGPAFGHDKVRYAAVSQLLLMPGLVGLAVLDSFALATPIVTTNISWHSPEIEYIENGRNGIIVSPADDVDIYATAVCEFLIDRQRRMEVMENCRRSALTYTTERMARCFVEGLIKALSRE